MFAIAGNLCRDFLRKQRKRRGEFSLQTPLGQDSGFTIQDTFSDTAATPDEVANSNEKLATIEHAIDQLPHKLKLPFITCTLEGHSYDECAEIIGSNRKTVETRIYRARKMLQSQLSNL
jgi:RNA polymerase sigma-70 factor (ECF subfamily)